MDGVLVFFQFLLLAFLFGAKSIDKAFSLSHFERSQSLNVVSVLGFFSCLIFMFIAAKKMGKFGRIHPKPATDSPLLNQGVYAYSRHPMYSGIVFGSLFWSLHLASYFALLVSFFLIIVLILKAKREEYYLLLIHGQAYRDYQKTVGIFTRHNNLSYGLFYAAFFYIILYRFIPVLHTAYMLLLAQVLLVVIFAYKLFVVGLKERKPFCFYGFEVQQKRDPTLYWCLYFLSLILWVLFMMWIYFTLSQLQF